MDSRSTKINPFILVHKEYDNYQETVLCPDLIEPLLLFALQSWTLTLVGMLNVGSIPSFPTKANVMEKMW
jgi:hypothetical protein